MELKRKRVGILTFSYGCNYGGTLQCLALYKTLIHLDYDVKIINFIPKYDSLSTRVLNKIKKSFSFKFMFLYFIRVVRDVKRKSKESGVESFAIIELMDLFAKFRASNMRMTHIVDENSISDIANSFDAIIVGSDQVWSDYTRKAYFLDWKPAYNGKRISYAACTSAEQIDFINATIIKKELNKFSAISVRDKNTFNFVKRVSNIVPKIVLDPTLLYDFSEFIGKRLINEPYIFSYIIGKEINGGHCSAISCIKTAIGDISLISINYPQNLSKSIETISDKVIYNATPDKWLNLIYYSIFVYTDSYHGALFSIKYKKPFVCYCVEDKRRSRFIEIENEFGLKNRIVSSVDEICNIGNPCYITSYDDVHDKIVVSKKHSISFLCDSINNA